MDLAVKYDQLDVVKWLHENRSEGCTVSAMKNAVISGGNFDMLLFLHNNRSEDCSANAICDADLCVKHMEMVQWLYANYPASVNIQALAASTSYMPMLFTDMLPPL